jgi:hypothetical protein
MKLYDACGRAIAQAVCRRTLTSAARVRARVNPVGLCDGKSDTGTGFSLSSSVFPCQYHSTMGTMSSTFPKIQKNSFILTSSSSGDEQKAHKRGRSPARRQYHSHYQNIEHGMCRISVLNRI